MSTEKELINQLDQVRRDRNITLAELGEVVGKHRVQVGDFFKMKNAARLQTSIEIANALGYDVVLLKSDIEPIQSDNISETKCECFLDESGIFRRKGNCTFKKQQHKF